MEHWRQLHWMTSFSVMFGSVWVNQICSLRLVACLMHRSKYKMLTITQSKIVHCSRHSSRHTARRNNYYWNEMVSCFEHYCCKWIYISGLLALWSNDPRWSGWTTDWPHSYIVGRYYYNKYIRVYRISSPVLANKCTARMIKRGCLHQLVESKDHFWQFPWLCQIHVLRRQSMHFAIYGEKHLVHLNRLQSTIQKIRICQLCPTFISFRQ